MNSSQSIIVGLGEILWDLFPDGPKFGGAPANFACHVASLGGHAEMVSAVGNDELGAEAILILQDRKVGTDNVQQHSDRPTGTVNVSLDEAGHASYEFAADTAWDDLRWTDEPASLAERTTAVCFGTLGQRSESSRKTIQQFVSSTPPHALRIFDINLRPPHFDESTIGESLQLANAVKLNDDELEFLGKFFGLSGSQPAMLEQMATRFNLQVVALTRGSAGAILWRDGALSESAGEQVAVADTVGAGDSFTAALVIGLIANNNLDAINQHASKVAAYVCTQAGATPNLPLELID